MPIAPSRQLLLASDEQRELTTILQLQDALLGYRITNFSRVKNSDFDSPEFSGSTRELARSLGSCIVDSPELQDRLIALLRPHDEAARSERTTTIVSVLLEVLLFCCHKRRESVHVGVVTKIANTILSARGETLTLSPRKTGSLLKSLGFRTTKLDAGGRGLYLLSEDQRRIHTLSCAYRTSALQDVLSGCPFCVQARNCRD